ncbi:MAG TPA: Lrp/AsnC family transcriptional regulator [Candidatus Methylomirabilis sp.]|nr:Lrp/AsnC family transcriptional regulator [Candidatus Methylomirabilis sp.]
MTRIDDLDAKIITLLRPDGRRSNVEIARDLGVAEGTVRKRIERLVRDQVIQIGAWADPLKIGYQDYINMELQVRMRDIEGVAQRLAKLPEIFFLGLCTGRAQIFAGCCFRSNEHFFEFMTKHLARIPGIQGISTSSITTILKREHSFPALPLTVPDGDGAAAGTDATTGTRHVRRTAPRAGAGRLERHTHDALVPRTRPASGSQRRG